MIGQDEEDDKEIDSIVWAWLAFALFSKHSTTSVETLSLKGYSLHENQAAVVEEVITSENSAVLMVAKSKPNEMDAMTEMYPPTHLRIPHGTAFTLLGKTTALMCTTSLEGLVVAEDSNNDERFVFIPGYGLVSISTQARQTKKARKTKDGMDAASSTQLDFPEGKSQFRAFTIKSTAADITSQIALPRLLEAIGHSLSSLRVKIPNVDEQLANRLILACPNLNHLTLAKTTAASMKVIEDAYARGTPLSSLALKQWRVPNEALETFLNKLRDNQSPVYATLRRFRIGKRWPTAFPASTYEIFERILRANNHLHHFAYYAPYMKDSDTTFVHEFRGMPVAESTGSPLDKFQTRAFLEGAYHVTRTNSDLALNEHVKAKILAFAANPRRREVVCWTDELMSGGSPLMRFHQW